MTSLPWKGKAISFLFIMLFISSTVFGCLLFVRTREVSTMDGLTSVMGQVEDTSGRFLEGVEVTCLGSKDVTGDDGVFLLESVPEGEISIEFYRPGFVLWEVDWVAYPLDELEGPLEGTVNNLSRDLPLTLLREETQRRPFGEYSNGTLGLSVHIDGDGPLAAGTYEVSNGTSFKGFELGFGPNRIEVQGNGTFQLRAFWSNRTFGSFQPVGADLNITGDLETFFGPELQVMRPTSGGLTMKILSEVNTAGTLLVLTSSYGRLETILEVDLKAGENLTSELVLRPGVYNLRVSGREVLDVAFLDIPVGQGMDTKVDVPLAKAGKERTYEGLSIEANYYIAALNIVLGALFLLGSVISWKKGSWFVAVSLAFLGFVSNGILFLYIDMNHVISVLLVIFLLFVFRDEWRDRRRSRSGRTLLPPPHLFFLFSMLL